MKERMSDLDTRVQALLLAALAKTVGETIFLDMTLCDDAQGDMAILLEHLAMHKKPECGHLPGQRSVK